MNGGRQFLAQGGGSLFLPISAALVIAVVVLVWGQKPPLPATSPAAPITAESLADSLAGRAAFDVHIPIRLAHAILRVENPRFDTLAVSPAGAIGLTQVMPAWENEFLVECGPGPLTNPARNTCVGMHVLAHYLELENGDVPRALCRYNGAHRAPRACGRYKDAVLRELVR